MPNSAVHSRLVHLTTYLASSEYLSLVLLARFEIACGNFVLRLEILSSCWTAQKVRFDGISEGEFFCRLSAEHDHVGVIRCLESFRGR